MDKFENLSCGHFLVKDVCSKEIVNQRKTLLNIGPGILTPNFVMGMYKHYKYYDYVKIKKYIINLPNNGLFIQFIIV